LPEAALTHLPSIRSCEKGCEERGWVPGMGEGRLLGWYGDA
jgi:hypothetical protein